MRCWAMLKWIARGLGEACHQLGLAWERAKAWLVTLIIGGGW